MLDIQLQVFEDSDMLRGAVTSLCMDRLPRFQTNPEAERAKNSAVQQLCWDVMPLQSRRFSASMLRERCAAILARSKYAPIRDLKPDDLANEISAPSGGW